jgi:hypothetical protein
VHGWVGGGGSGGWGEEEVVGVEEVSLTQSGTNIASISVAERGRRPLDV